MSRRMAWTVLLVLFLSHFWIIAAEASDTGNLEIECNTEKNGQTVYLSQDIYAVTLIANTEIVDGHTIAYRMRSELEIYERDWGDLSAAELQASAEELAVYAADHHFYDQTAVADSEGKVIFESLDTGLYLVARIQVDEKNSGYQTEPVLVTIPSFEDGGFLYDVSIDLKFDWVSKPEIPSTMPESQMAGEDVKTGDLVKIDEIFCLMFFSLLVLILIVKSRKLKK